MYISRLNLMRGRIIQGISPEEAAEYPLTEMDKSFIEKVLKNGGREFSPPPCIRYV